MHCLYCPSKSRPIFCVAYENTNYFLWFSFKISTNFCVFYQNTNKFCVFFYQNPNYLLCCLAKYQQSFFYCNINSVVWCLSKYQLFLFVFFFKCKYYLTFVFFIKIPTICMVFWPKYRLTLVLAINILTFVCVPSIFIDLLWWFLSKY